MGPNIFSLNLAKFTSEKALAGEYVMLFKFNVYPRFAISRQLSLLELSP